MKLTSTPTLIRWLCQPDSISECYDQIRLAMAGIIWHRVGREGSAERSIGA